MTILFAGGELDSFTFPNGLPTASTNSGYYDPAFARCAIQTGPNIEAVATLPSDYLEAWFHAEVLRVNATGTNTVLLLQNLSGQDVVRFVYNNSTALLTFQYWNGSSYVDIGTTALVAEIRYVFDVRCNIAASGGSFEFYVNGVLTASFTGNTLRFSGSAIGKAVIAGTWPGAPSISVSWSQIIIADEDTRTMKLATLAPNANGTITQWSGSFTDVDDVGVINDADFVFTGSADQREFFGLSDLSSTAQALDVIAVVQAGRARIGLTGPQNIQGSLYIGSSEYNSGNLTGLSTTFNALQSVVWANNPATSGPWSVAAVQALQMGYKSIA